MSSPPSQVPASRIPLLGMGKPPHRQGLVIAVVHTSLPLVNQTFGANVRLA
ncbi:hypothetical protein EIP91_002563 [Steccherinum ochraceum]|uniref:Uncharacterized protein n=1 Tax=Steccherinum ochraceum TaxID=92696 RepID=A0A4R0RIA7_9APHY|nr:hypothetical protein EIP91_002563 [Steccherinum ochraceum]